MDELPESEAIAVGLFKLLVASEPTAGEQARQMLANANKVELDLIEQILTYKFRTLKREEIRKMLKIQEELLKDTAFYKEAFEEGKAEGEERGLIKGEERGLLKGRQEGKAAGERAAKLATVPLLRKLGLSDEQIAQELGLILADVQSVPTEPNS